jgi:SAM-dependent methyltransferase
MDPIAVELLLDEAGPSAAVNQADRTFPVGPAPHRLVEASYTDERGAAHGRSRAEAAVQDRRALIRDIERARLLEATNCSTIDLVDEVGAEQIEVRSPSREGRKRLQPLRQVCVIGSEDGKEFPLRELQGRIHRGGDAAMLLAEVSDPLQVRLQHSRCLVGRAVVADDHLECGQRLRERRLDRLGERRGGVVRGDHDGKRRLPARMDLADRGRHPEDASPRPSNHVLIMPTNPTVCKGGDNVCLVSTRPTIGELGAAPDPLRWRKRLQRVRHPAWLGTIRRTKPLSDHYGRDRGTPVDRYYIEQFLAIERAAIRGRVLEVMNRDYTVRFGTAVDSSDVLDIDPGNPDATIVGDLTSADAVPTGSFDCFILTQTLQYIYDLKAAVAHAHRILGPGGTVLCTVPVVSRIDRLELGSEYWRLTAAACSRLFGDVFPPNSVTVRARGNVLAAIAFLVGMAAEELSTRKLERDDPFFPLVVTVRATKST